MSSRWSLLEALPMGTCVLDESGEVRAWNRVLAEWSGLRPEAVVGDPLGLHLAAFASSSFSTSLASILAGGPPENFAVQLVGPGACRAILSALPPSPGEPPLALLSIQHGHETGPRARADASNPGDRISRTRSAKPWHEGSELLELFGLGHTVERVLTRVLELVQETLPDLTARVLWFEQLGDEHTMELGTRSTDDTRAWICLPLHSTRGDRLGELQAGSPGDRGLFDDELEDLAVLARIAAITIERGQDERSRRVLSAIVRSNSDAIIGYAADGTIESWNRAAEEILGFKEEEVLGRPFTTLADSESRSEINDILLWALRGNTYSDLETSWTRKDGRRIALSLTLSPIVGEEQRIIGTAVIARDITERKRHEAELLRYTQEVERHRELLEVARDEALRASKVKADFLSTMSHEIRTPMNGIIGMTEQLLETDLDEQQLDSARTIQVSGESLLAIINDILDISKIEAGKLVFEHVSFDLRKCLEDVVVLTRLEARSKGVELELNWDPSAPRFVESDPVRLRQVALNLVGNAIKFTSEGSVGIHVRAGAEEDGVQPVSIEVRDTGIGFSQDQAESIFQAFQQADSSTTRRYGGTGLGLAICKRICEGLGGSVRAESVPDQGSTFEVTLPLRASALPVDVGVGSRPCPAEIFELDILLVEDNLINQKVALAALTRFGCRVEVAENGRQAIERLSQRTFDVILMDCQMPEMNGYDATREIRARGLADATPILAMTANAMAEDRKRCLEAGMDGYLAKPFRRTELRELLHEHGFGRELEQDERAA